MVRSLLAVIAALALAGVARADIKELTTPNEAIYFSKSTEIAIMGMFKEKKGAEWDLFKQVAKEFDKDSGIALGYTTDKAVYGRYLEGDQAPPQVMVFSSFAPETGLIQKGKKARALFEGSFTYTELHTFFLRESQPLVLRLPQNLGPDFQKRMMLAFQSRMPKVFVFGKAPDDAPEALVEAAKVFRGRCLAFYYTVSPGDEEDEGNYHMKQMGLEPGDVNKGPVAAIAYQGSPEPLEWEGDAASLAKKVNEYLDEQPAYEPVEGAKKAKSPVGKKKKSTKKDL
mmetsp:Transcript_3881/g.9792  ORF Transcript_3881/g.9792 Transcript_3881/m.9792 type:complete len:284 (+) Transcript_3881:22-873(+)